MIYSMGYVLSLLLPIVVLLLNLLIHRNDGWRFVGMAGCLVLALAMLLHSNWFVFRNLIPMLRIGYRPIDFGFSRIISRELKLMVSIYPYRKDKLLVVLEDFTSKKEKKRLKDFELKRNDDLIAKIVQFEKSNELDIATGIPLINRMNEMNGVLRDFIVKGED